ncbi:hypothetical protein [Natrinema hispanicum]|uniref:Uncharacterized protein n=1 Tax=Natrinema hispanicum TaxID=392421 RepID=A0A1H9YE75_9EURY|nr:hypothetical protein [Natrinema hispanicum]SDC19004.1 hypothetical protein SAMN05192552_100274 [Natrinema hispanicum]SES67291.1 hypothetical protein SAMN04488694_10174 [Natrinema hispanicum]
MTDSQLQDRVQEILTEAGASSGSLVAGDGGDEAAETELFETATEANDLLESADPDELLTAVGLDTLEDGTEPGSIPEAIARGKQEHVADLQRLLRLANLADRADEDCLEVPVSDLRETISERTASAAGDEEQGVGGDRSDELAADESDDAEETAADLEDRLRSSMKTSFEQFGDEIRQLKARLETASAGTPSREGANAETADDEGLAETGRGGDRNRGTASGSPTSHSTLAPPPSERADMQGTGRYSTMPDKHE